METILEASVFDSIIPYNSRRIHYGIEQLHTKYILYNILLESIPKGAIAYMAITAADLYPRDDWNFVFGQANLKKRVAVSSVNRLKQENTDSSNYQLYLKRILKTATHEIGHMFSLKHCTNYRCLMNGSISLAEADKKPMWLCPDCLAKISWCTNKNIVDRCDNLLNYFHQKGFKKEEEFYRKSKQILYNLK